MVALASTASCKGRGKYDENYDDSLDECFETDIDGDEDDGDGDSCVFPVCTFLQLTAWHDIFSCPGNSVHITFYPLPTFET